MASKGSKWRVVAWSLGGVVGLLVVVLAYALVSSRMRMGKRYEVTVADVPVAEGVTALAEGERLFVSRGCSDCHGSRGEGKVFMDGPPALLGGTNLTEYVQHASSLDFVRAVRHGIGQNGRPLIFMPSHELQALNDEELSQVIAYTRSLPRVASPSPAISVRPLGNVLHTFGLFHLIPAELIDHTATRTYAKREASVEYGKGLSAQCTGCHGAGLSGGPIPGAPPELGNPRNLTPHATGLASWKEADFVKAMREGVTPDGRHLNPAQMPWPTMGKLNDTELGALFAYLKTVPAKPAGSR